uniref:Uncharacterized protein n=1 Tax=Schistosoma curassoni TaxID=6186 RepID=A0A183KN26_9TREM
MSEAFELVLCFCLASACAPILAICLDGGGHFLDCFRVEEIL